MKTPFQECLFGSLLQNSFLGHPHVVHVGLLVKESHLSRGPLWPWDCERSAQSQDINTIMISICRADKMEDTCNDKSVYCFACLMKSDQWAQRIVYNWLL